MLMVRLSIFQTPAATASALKLPSAMEKPRRMPTETTPRLMLSISRSAVDLPPPVTVTAPAALLIAPAHEEQETEQIAEGTEEQPEEEPEAAEETAEPPEEELEEET